MTCDVILCFPIEDNSDELPLFFLSLFCCTWTAAAFSRDSALNYAAVRHETPNSVKRKTQRWRWAALIQPLLQFNWQALCVSGPIGHHALISSCAHLHALISRPERLTDYHKFNKRGWNKCMSVWSTLGLSASSSRRLSVRVSTIRRHFLNMPKVEIHNYSQSEFRTDHLFNAC